MGWLKRKQKKTKSAEEASYASIGRNLDINPDNYNPDVHRKWLNNSNRIPITIDGYTFWTYRDIDNVQRFKDNEVIRSLYEKAKQEADEGGTSIFTEFNDGKFNTRDWLYFLTSAGCSVDEVRALPEFAHLSFS